MSETGARNRPAVIRATITGKNQITIPAVVVRALQLKPGMQVQFELRDDRSVVMRPVESSAEKVERLEGTLQPHFPPGEDPISDLVHEREQDDQEPA